MAGLCCGNSKRLEVFCTALRCEGDRAALKTLLNDNFAGLHFLPPSSGAMGYAGYFSTTARIKDKRTPLEAALANVGSLETLELLEKVTKNSAVQPAEEKYRRLKLSNAKIRSLVAEVEGGLEAMAALGWQQVQEEGEEVLTLAKGAATMAQVRCILEAQQEFKKNDHQLKRAKSSASLPGSDEQAALRAQIEADRLERAARSPVAKDSVAQALPGEGARIATAKDCGIKCEC